MPTLACALRAWPSRSFAQALKRELEDLHIRYLPLEKGTTHGGMVDDDALTVTVLGVEETGEYILAKIGVFFTEIVICCGCGDDPMSVNAYCQMQVVINKQSAEASFELLED
jgi:hypothetical protein